MPRDYDTVLRMFDIAADLMDDTHFQEFVKRCWSNSLPPFQHCTPTGGPGFRVDETTGIKKMTGCLTQVHNPEYHFHAWTDELTARIKDDDLIPDYPSGINRDNYRERLRAFVRFQDEMDRTIRQGIIPQ